MPSVRSLTKLLVLPILLGLVLAACDTGGTNPEVRYRILLTDAPFPFDLVEEVNVTIERVELVGSDAGTVVIADEPRAFDLLTLRNGTTAELGVETLPAGAFEQLRLVIGEASEVVMNDGSVYALRVPSGTETGIKINLPAYADLLGEDNETVEVVADFDVEDSFVVQGNPDSPSGINGFIFKPVLKLASFTIGGEEVPVDETDPDE